MISDGTLIQDQYPEAVLERLPEDAGATAQKAGETPAFSKKPALTPDEPLAEPCGRLFSTGEPPGEGNGRPAGRNEWRFDPLRKTRSDRRASRGSEKRPRSGPRASRSGKTPTRSDPRPSVRVRSPLAPADEPPVRFRERPVRDPGRALGDRCTPPASASNGLQAVQCPPCHEDPRSHS